MGPPWSGKPPSQIGYASNFQPDTQQGPFRQFAAQMPQAYDTQNQPTFQAGQSFITNLLNSQFNPQQYEQYFQQGVVNPALKNYEQQILPQLKSNYYTGSGVYGSSLNQAINQSASELQNNLGSLRANYLMQGQQQHTQNQMSALAQALGFAQAPAQSANAYYSQLFNARPVSPMLQEAQSGWLQDLVKGGIENSGDIAKLIAAIAALA